MPTDDTKDGEISLGKLLQAADLLSYESALRTTLKLRHAGDIQYVEEQDLLGIGMSRPEQKRLRKEYERLIPSGLMGKLKKAFTRTENFDRKDSTQNNEIEDDQHVIPLERINLCKELGSGEFGSVWQATWRSSNGEVHQVAVKCVDPLKLTASSSSFLQEAAIMTRMRHDNVVRLFGVVLDTRRVMMVSELAACGSLLECLVKPALRDSFAVHVLCDYALQIAMGMAYLESQRLIHRDLAARNVLVFSPKKVKISDFGLSRSLGIGEDYYRSEFNPNLKLPIAWCAPECINFLKFTSASDVWAYGVTLWEMFTYGEMPWNGFTGAEILDAVDRQRKHLPRPQCCPEDIYDTMKDCWVYSPLERPTFSYIVSVFPERLPQTVRGVCDVRDGVNDHLSFKKDDLITVIDRAPSSYPDGYYWYGSLRNGACGLFRPADTVAHLDSELPIASKVITSCVSSDDRKEERKPSKKMSKEQERERRKKLISEPVGEVRHTCHVGIDGYAFGLHQLDKKEQLPPNSPEHRRSVGSTTPTVNSAVHLRAEQTRAGVPIRETVSMRDIDALRAAAANIPNGRSHSRASIEPSAPPLTASAANSLTKDLRYADDWNSLRSANSTTLLLDSECTNSSIKRPKPVCAVYARTPASQPISQPSDDALEAELRYLDRDLTDFSISTMSTLNDYSDTRPLLDSQRPTIPEITNQAKTSTVRVVTSSIRPMTDEEMGKWQEKQSREHRKADTLLVENKKKERAAIVEPFERKYNGVENSSEWSEAAQEAYKLLVECGSSLKLTTSPAVSPNPSRKSTLERKEKKVAFADPSAPPRPITPPLSSRGEGLASPTQKKVHIIETKLINGPCRSKSPPGLPPKCDAKPPGLPPKMRQVPVSIDGRLNYDNLNGIGAGRQPPPVPPKPKVNINSSSPPPVSLDDGDSPGMAPAIARSALLSNREEELVKF